MRMKLGISLPLVDIKGDPATVRDFAQTAEGLGYRLNVMRRSGCSLRAALKIARASGALKARASTRSMQSRSTASQSSMRYGSFSFWPPGPATCSTFDLSCLCSTIRGSLGRSPQGETQAEVASVSRRVPPRDDAFLVAQRDIALRKLPRCRVICRVPDAAVRGHGKYLLDRDSGLVP